MIKRFASMIQSAVKAVTSKKEIECAIDDEVISCDSLGEVYYSPEAQGTWWTGVPAPAVLEDDPWFGPAPKSDKQNDYEETVAAESQIEEDQRKEETQEPENIHQVMYEIATSNWNTVDETKQSMGGSENIQNWNSGTGMGQFIGQSK